MERYSLVKKKADYQMSKYAGFFLGTESLESVTRPTNRLIVSVEHLVFCLPS